jgi:DNA-binding CsgD family transcriptional regulator
MGSPPDFVRKRFAPLLEKTLPNALAHCIGKEFPKIGGRRIRHLCAEMILEVIGRPLRRRDHLSHGQVLWMAISLDDPPARGKRTADTEMVPVVLDVSTPDDVQARLERRSWRDRLEAKLVRLCHQAHAQKALLSNCDLAELFSLSDGYVASILTAHEQRTGQIVPRRATLHDVGTGLTHKRIICRKRYLEGKSPDQIARETYHSLEAVDRYLGHYDRVRHCRLQGMNPDQIAYTLNCSRTLVHEYLAIDRELGDAK